jgi:serine protease Do
MVTGAGVIIDRAGLVLTQYLVVQDGDQHTVTTIDGKIYPATIKGADPRSGLAVLATESSALPRPGYPKAERDPQRPIFPSLPFGDTAALRKGQFVIALGNPYAIRSGGQPTASWGIVTNLARKAPVGANLNGAPGPSKDYRTTLHHLGTLIQTDARLGWSAGGGALVNLRGELVGVTTTVATIAGHEQPAGYAIPMSAAMQRIIDTLKDGREVEYGLLGISFGFGPIGAANDAESRVTVQNVVPGTPAARAGFAPGDIITHVDGLPIGDVDDIQLAVSVKPPSSTTTIEYERRGMKDRAEVTLAKLPVAGERIITSRPPAWQGVHVDYATAIDPRALGEVTASEAFDPEGCVLVSHVEPESEAWAAGIRAGMFISHVGSRRVATPEEFREAVTGAGSVREIRLTQPVQPASDGAARQ